jgi:signal transduction histidine kinase
VLTAPNLLRIRPLARIAEFVALLLLLTLTCFIIFSDLPLIPIQLHVLAFAVLPFIVWAAMRFGVSGAALSTLIVATISTVETALDSGPFAQNTPFTNGVLLDVFFVVLSVSGMTFAAVIAEKEQAERERERLALEHAEIKALASVGPKLIEAQEQERARIGRELHDDIVQRLALLAVELERVQQRSPDLHSRLGELRKQTSDIAIDLQSLSHELHSSKLEYLGVAFAMKSFCKEFGEQQKVEIDFQSHDLPSPVPPDISLCLFRVLQEALHNSVKHSGARHFEARLWGTSDQINLTVRDSGLGFDIEAAKESRGLGLVSMQERVRLVKGTLSIESQPKRGTTIHACVPLSRESDSMRAAG